MPTDLAALLAPHAQPRVACLDVGCGDGSVGGGWLVEHGCRYQGVDISETAITMARAAGFEADTIEDAAQLPFASDVFDLALCREVLEHLFDPLGAVREMLRVLKPGGVLVATVPNAVYWRRRAEFALGRWNPYGDKLSVEQPWRDPHIRFFTMKTIHRMLAAVGYESIGVTGHGEGGFLRDIPKIGPRFYRGGDSSRLYKMLERRNPSLYACRLGITAWKPSKL